MQPIYINSSIHLQCMACCLEPDPSVHEPSTAFNYLIVMLCCCGGGGDGDRWLLTTSRTGRHNGYQIILLIVQRDALLFGHVLSQCINKMVL